MPIRSFQSDETWSSSGGNDGAAGGSVSTAVGCAVVVGLSGGGCSTISIKGRVSEGGASSTISSGAAGSTVDSTGGRGSMCSAAGSGYGRTVKWFRSAFIALNHKLALRLEHLRCGDW